MKRLAQFFVFTGSILFGVISTASAAGAQLPQSTVLILSKDEGTLAIVDASTLKVVGKVQVGVNPHEVAACQDGRCTAVDWRETEVRSCVTKDDCKARDSRCCGCDGLSGEARIAIGVAQDEAYAKLRCDPGMACADCATSLPDAPDGYLACFNGSCGIAGFVH